MIFFFLLRGWFAARPKKEGRGGGAFLRKGIDTTATLPNTAALPPLSACQRGEEGGREFRVSLAPPPPTLPSSLGTSEVGGGGGRERGNK